MYIYFSAVVAIIGALFWGLSNNAIVKEMGKMAFFAGLLAFCLTGPEHIWPTH